MYYNNDEIKLHLREYVEQVTTHSKGKFYCCPLCGSGTNNKKTGAFYIYDETNTWTCYSCHKGGDIINLYKAINQCTSKEAIEQLAEMYNVSEIQTPPQAKQHEEKKAPPAAKAAAVSFKNVLTKWAEALPGSAGEQYLIKRGFTVNTMQRFMLGTDGRYITIPYNKAGTYYGKRAIDNQGRIHNNLQSIKIPLFNPAALYDSDICFVVESPLCAISIEQCGQSAVALSGTGGGKRLLEQLRTKPAKCTLILCLDNDKAGRDATPELAKCLEDAGYRCIDATNAVLGTEEPGTKGYYKDPNEVLQADPEELRQRLQDAADECRRLIKSEEATEAERRAITSGPESIDRFLEVVKTERYKPIPTGIKDIDEVIGGGFIRQQLIMLGAAPGAGKTALAQWIFETIAAKGLADVLYLNLEMSREQMISRALSRMAKQHGIKLKVIDVLQGYRWDRDTAAAVIATADLYKRTVAQHLVYNPDGITADLDTIIAFMEQEAVRAETKANNAPICVIDYLQILRGAPREDAVETIKRAITSFKQYAVAHNTIVFVIMANNRDSNKSGDVTMESGRDTSNIEYSADLQMGLAFTRCLNRPGQTAKRKDELNPEEKPFKTLRITKGRFGGEDTEVDLYFNGESMSFTQISDIDLSPNYAGRQM